MGSVFQLIEKTNSPKSWGARQVLLDALKDLDEGRMPEDAKLMVLYAKDDAKTFSPQYIQCGMTTSEMVGMLEVAKFEVLHNNRIE